MADSKISALPASTVPLAGTEVLPIVQSSTTKQVSVANLTAGRSFEALGMTLTSTDAGATAAPILDLYRDSATPAASDTLGEIEFNGEDSAGNKQAYGLIHASILSPTSTAEQGQLHFETATAGALTEKMIIGTTNLVINEIGAVFNVRIEGDTDANLFTTDATNSRVGVGTISPAEKLDVVGKIKVSDNIVIGTSGKGIDFAATAGTGTSELLADYEEGTFSVASDSAQVVLVANTCFYTKIGRQVTCTGSIEVASIGSPTGNLGFDGLPFTIANADGANTAIAIYAYGWAATMTTTVMGAASKNAASWYVQKTNALGSVAVLSGDVQAGTVIWFCISYMTT
jgi:hypothetical protein